MLKFIFSRSQQTAERERDACESIPLSYAKMFGQFHFEFIQSQTVGEYSSVKSRYESSRCKWKECHEFQKNVLHVDNCLRDATDAVYRRKKGDTTTPLDKIRVLLTTPKTFCLDMLEIAISRKSANLTLILPNNAYLST